MFLVVHKEKFTCDGTFLTEEEAKNFIRHSDNHKIVYLGRYELKSMFVLSQMHFDNEHLVDCIKNLMGFIDTPIGRRQIQGEMIDEARKIARDIIKKYDEDTLEEEED